MSNDFYGSAYVETCLRLQHQFNCVWSDKTPMKVSLICRTCSDAQNKPVYVAYGDDTKSFGVWHTRRDREKENTRESSNNSQFLSD